MLFTVIVQAALDAAQCYELVEACRGVIARVLLQLLMTAATSRRDYALLSVVIYVPISQAHMIRRCQHWLPSLSAARAK